MAIITRAITPHTFALPTFLARPGAAGAIEPSRHAGVRAHGRPEVMLGRGVRGERARGRVEDLGTCSRRLWGRERRGASTPTGQRCPSENSSPGDR